MEKFSILEYFLYSRFELSLLLTFSVFKDKSYEAGHFLSQRETYVMSACDVLLL